MAVGWRRYGQPLPLGITTNGEPGVLPFMMRSQPNSNESQAEVPEPPSSQPQTIRESIREAAEQAITQSPGIQDALELVMTSQLRDIADDEIETVRQYRQQKMGITGASTQSPGSSRDLIVAKDMHFHQPQPVQAQQSNTAGFAIAGGSGIIAAAILASTMLLRSQPEQEKMILSPPAAETPAPEDADPGIFGIGRP